jgi:tetratricopeptide (TPR) repeat protein
MAIPLVKRGKLRLAVLLVAWSIFVAGGIVALLEMGCRWIEKRRQVSTAALSSADSAPMYLPKKQPDEFRVFLYGGSSVAGGHVPEIGFAKQLEFWLTRLYPNRPIRVCNYGRAGADTAGVLSAMVETIQMEPDLAVVMTGHNEFLSPESASHNTARPNPLQHLALVRAIKRVYARYYWSRRENILPAEPPVWDRASPAFRERIARYRKEVEAIKELSHSRNVPLVLGTLPSNILDWPPAAATGRKAGPQTQAAASYHRGRVEYKRGNFDRAKRLLMQAKDLDPVSWRVLGEFNDFVRAAACGRDVYLIDIEKEFEDHSKGGLIGYELISDNCHATPLGDSLIAKAIINTIIEAHLLPDSRDAIRGYGNVELFLKAAGFDEVNSELKIRYLLTNAVYCMKTPFLNYEAAKKYLAEAMRIAPANWEAWANLATVSFFEHNWEGCEQLKRALEIKPELWQSDSAAKVPYLAEALRAAQEQGVSCTDR